MKRLFKLQPMNYEKLRKELVRGVRGKRSQTAVNKRLKYSFNQAYRWESGKTRILWQEFVTLCRACRVDIDHWIRVYFGFQGDPIASPELIRHIIGSQSPADISAKMKISRSVLNNWLRGKSDPSLEQFLKLLDVADAGVIDFLAKLTSIENLPSLAVQFAQRRAERELYYEHPWMAAVVKCLWLEEYKRLPSHREGYISQKLGISLPNERLAIQKLSEVGAIKKVGTKFEPASKNIDTRWDFEGANRIREYWLRRALNVLQTAKIPPERGHFGYMVFSLSEEAFQKVCREYFDFYSKVNAIAAEDRKDQDSVMALGLQLFDLAVPEQR